MDNDSCEVAFKCFPSSMRGILVLGDIGGLVFATKNKGGGGGGGVMYLLQPNCIIFF